MSQTLEIQDSQHPNRKENDQEEENDEALSFSDLPLTVSSENNAQNQTENGSDFEFGSVIGSVSGLESEMCAADDIFSGGQMLPFRRSVSTEGRLSGFRAPTRSLSGSDSVDRRTGLGPSRSSSSRSSSTRSQQSATTSISSGSSSSKPGNRSRPSPNPQIRASGAGSPNPKSTMWQVLRLGLVRTPEIELHDLIVGHRSSNNKNTPIHSVPRNDDITRTEERKKIEEMRKKRNRINRNGIFGSCNCSIGAIEPIFMPTQPRFYSSHNSNALLMSHHRRQQQQQKQRETKPGKRVASGHRTFEWLRDVSQTRVLNS